MKLYFIGQKGSGMSSLAQLLKSDGYEVIGEDITKYLSSQNGLQKRRIPLLPLNSYKNTDADIYIVGHDFENVESDLKSLGRTYLRYNEFLAFYLYSKNLIAISGSHGKTTLTGFLASLLNASYLRGDGASFLKKKSQYFVFEACEYQDHFLKYNPSEVILTNIDYDHVDYFKDEKSYIFSFNKFLNKAPLCFIPYSLSKLLDVKNKAVTFGDSLDADYSFQDMKVNDKGCISFDIYHRKEYETHIETRLKGIQFATFILISYAFFKEHNIEFPISKIDNFKATSRRFNIRKYKSSYLVDDYAHHPSQIRLHYQNVEYLYPKYYKIAIFKPDRYSRVIAFKEEFEKVLSKFDEVYILPFACMKENEGKEEFVLNISNAQNILSKEELAIKLKNKKGVVVSYMSSKESKEYFEIIKKVIS